VYGAPTVGSGGVCSRTVGFVLVRRDDVFTFNFFIKKVCIFFTFKAIFRNNAAITVLLFNAKLVPFPLTLTSHTVC
jgi:hypothetical protein